jgi:hypothetical protein
LKETPPILVLCPPPRTSPLTRAPRRLALAAGRQAALGTGPGLGGWELGARGRPRGSFRTGMLRLLSGTLRTDSETATHNVLRLSAVGHCY